MLFRVSHGYAPGIKAYPGDLMLSVPGQLGIWRTVIQARWLCSAVCLHLPCHLSSLCIFSRVCISSSLSFMHARRSWVGAAHTDLCLVGPQLSACLTAAGETSPLGNPSPELPQSRSPPQMLFSPCISDKGSRFSLLLIQLSCCSWVPLWSVALSLAACQSQAGG